MADRLAAGIGPDHVVLDCRQGGLIGCLATRTASRFIG
jgi:hypothetical protein